MAKTATLTPAPTTTTVAETLFDSGPMANVADFDPIDILDGSRQLSDAAPAGQ
jgi:hypothetical protein